MTYLFSTAFIAPAGAVQQEAVETASRILSASGVKVKTWNHVFDGDPSGYLSAPLPCRVQDLEEAWCGNNDVLWCARGGYGAMAVAAAADWQKLNKAAPAKPLIGYSDITALHMRMLKENTGRPIVAAMASTINNGTAAEIYNIILHGNTKPYPVTAVYGDFPRSGLVTAANMAVLSGLCGTDSMPDMTGRILLLEDVNEPVYKLDRYLTQFEQNGILDKISAVAAGDFLQCGENADIIELFKKFAITHNKPLVCNAPFGHRTAPFAMDMSKEIIFDIQ